MHAQTPVQIARVTRDLEANETALTGLLGAKKWAFFDYVKQEQQ
jgi:hypothetical protein